MSDATHKRKSRLPSAAKRYMGNILARTMAPTSVANELTRSKRVQFSSVDTVLTFGKESTSSPLPATGKPMSQGIGMCNDYGTIFHYKRQKLQELAEKALSLKRGEKVLYGSTCISMLLQRLEILSNRNVATESQKKVLDTPDIPIGTGKRSLQSNFQPQTYSFLDTKYGLEKVCIPLDICSDAEGLEHFLPADKFSGIKTSVFQGADYVSLISPSMVNEVQQGGNDGHEWSHHGITDFDFVTDSVYSGQQLGQGIDFDPESILDTRYLHYPHSFFCESCPFDNDHKWTSKDFPLPDLQSNRCHGFESLDMKMNNLGSICTDKINYKPKNSSFMNDMTMQLLDHKDEFKYQRQDFCPEMGMILWTPPKKNLNFDLLPDHEDKHKHYKKEFIPETGLILWSSPNKDVFSNLKCCKNEDFYLQATSQIFSPTFSLWKNDEDTDPNLGFSFSSIEQQYGDDNWGTRESLSYLPSREMDLLQGQHKLHGNTNGSPYMNVNEQYYFMQADGQEVPGFYNSPCNSRDMKYFPVKLNWGLENALNIPDIDLVREKRWESLALSIYPDKVETMQPWDRDCDSYGAEHVGLIPYSHFSFKNVWQTGGQDIQEFSGLNDAHCLATDNNLSLLSGQIDSVKGSAFSFNSFSLGNQPQSMSNMLTGNFIHFQDFFSHADNNEKSLFRRNYIDRDRCADRMDARTYDLEILSYSPSGQKRQREGTDWLLCSRDASS